eukprot:358020-Chlamydomonas_euryale.AAC.4
MVWTAGNGSAAVAGLAARLVYSDFAACCVPHHPHNTKRQPNSCHTNCTPVLPGPPEPQNCMLVPCASTLQGKGISHCQEKTWSSPDCPHRQH